MSAISVASAATDATSADPVHAASSLVPLLRARAEQAQTLGRLTDDVVEALDDSGLLGLMASTQRGGYQASASTLARVLRELATGCGSASWVCGIYAGGLYVLCATFPERVQDEVFAIAHPKVAVAFQLAGTARRVSGGYRLTGKWRFASGEHHATWAMLSSIITDTDTAPCPAQFLLPRADCLSGEDWQVSGLAGSGSSTLLVDDVFVPEHRVVPLADPHHHDPYFRQPVVPLLVAGATGTLLGLADAAVNLFRERVHTRGITYSHHARQAEAEVTHLQVSEASMLLAEADFHSQQATAILPQLVDDPGHVALRVTCRAHAGRAVRHCRDAVRIVQEASGAGAIRRQDPLSRIVGDIEALAVHSLLLPSTNAELHGRVLCGLSPDVPYI